MWNTDLSSFDPDGPPRFRPRVGRPRGLPGRVKHVKDPVATAQRWREIAQAENLSIRDLVVRESPRFAFVGLADTVAQKMNQHIQEPPLYWLRPDPTAPGAAWLSSWIR